MTRKVFGKLKKLKTDLQFECFFATKNRIWKRVWFEQRLNNLKNAWVDTLREWRDGLHLTNKEASTVLCSVVKHAGSG